MKIVVLAGGLSPERDVSLSSGSLIANALMDAGHEVLLMDVYEGIGFEEAKFRTKEQGEPYSYEIPAQEPDLADIVRKNGGQQAYIGKNVLAFCAMADVVFIALHGAMGENGQLQATFDNFRITYTGTGYTGSLLAMDKSLSKTLFDGGNIPTAPWVVCTPGEEGVRLIEEKIGYPCVVKPTGCGSSVGVSIVDNRYGLESALKLAGRYEPTVLVEKKIQGREFSVGILDGEVLPPIEIIPLNGFYDYKNKYQNGMTKEICPADLTPEQEGKLKSYAAKVFALLRLEGYARVDFIMDGQGECWCLEANTLPGMTPVSLLPQEAAAVGIDYVQLCEKIAYLALEKGNR